MDDFQPQKANLHLHYHRNESSFVLRLHYKSTSILSECIRPNGQNHGRKNHCMACVCWWVRFFGHRDKWGYVTCENADSFHTSIDFLSFGTTDSRMISDLVLHMGEYIELVERNMPVRNTSDLYELDLDVL